MEFKKFMQSNLKDKSLLILSVVEVFIVLAICLALFMINRLYMVYVPRLGHTLFATVFLTLLYLVVFFIMFGDILIFWFVQKGKLSITIKSIYFVFKVFFIAWLIYDCIKI
ncbi:MAG: hypothetical protein LBU60_03820 [Clostridiales bacterium]|nr:hypothetical protein [Clostridiales bacterium]